jgi:RES domain-containing protein
VVVWRITRDAYQALDGEGARLNGGRWSDEGRAVVYTSQSLSLAALEYLVHVDPLLAPSDLVAMEIELPDDPGVGAGVEPSQFPPGDWRAYPAPEWQAELGDLWLTDGTFLWLSVPSAIVPEERNVLVNPAHPDMRRVRVLSTRPFGFDRRLL